MSDSTRLRHVLALGALALTGAISAVLAAAGPPVNTSCPLTGEPVNASKVVTWNGTDIGFCCGKCVGAFEGWSDQKKDALAAKLAHGTATATGGAAAADPTKRVGDPYPLATCAVAGSKLGSMGDPVVKVYEGREVKFCCGGCVPKFEKDPKPYLEKVDAEIVRQQKASYPLTTCIVIGDPLEETGDDKAIDVVVNNRLVRVCCRMCQRKLTRDPAKYLAKLDEKIVAMQMKDYPTDVCVVGGGKLGSMGEPVNVVVANRLVRLCCSGCTKSLMKDPASYLAKLDEAQKKRK